MLYVVNCVMAGKAGKRIILQCGEDGLMDFVFLKAPCCSMTMETLPVAKRLIKLDGQLGPGYILCPHVPESPQLCVEITVESVICVACKAGTILWNTIVLVMRSRNPVLVIRASFFRKAP